MSRTLFTETTTISAQRTAGQIQEILMEAGARSIISQMDDNKKIVALAFEFEVKGHLIPFNLPIRSAGIYMLLRARHKQRRESEQRDREVAERMAWRNLLYWLKAQIVMIQSEQLTMPQVMLPFWQMPGGAKTLYERLESNGFKALPEPEKARGG